MFGKFLSVSHHVCLTKTALYGWKFLLSDAVEMS